MVEWLKNFIIPVIKTSFVAGIFGFLAWVFIRAGLKIWRTELKWFFRYTIFRRKYDPNDVKWILDVMKRDMGYFNMQKFLLIKGVSQDKINELAWIYVKIFKQLEGGQKNGQGTTRSYSETKSTKTTGLPADF